MHEAEETALGIAIGPARCRLAALDVRSRRLGGFVRRWEDRHPITAEAARGPGCAAELGDRGLSSCSASGTLGAASARGHCEAKLRRQRFRRFELLDVI